MGANAESFALTRCALARGLAQESGAIRDHKRSAVRDQRTSEGQPLDAAPTIVNAPKADLTALAGKPA
jgi:hypothetical protein